MSEIEILKNEIKKISIQLNKNLTDMNLIKDSLLSIIMMNLKNYYPDWLQNKKYNNLPTYMKNILSAAELFNTHIKQLVVTSRKNYDESWVDKNDKIIIPVIVPYKFHYYICGQFQFSNIISSAPLDIIFAENESEYKLGDEIPISLYDEYLKENYPRIKRCSLVTISTDDNYFIMDNKIDRCLYKISLHDFSYDDDRILGWH